MYTFYNWDGQGTKSITAKQIGTYDLKTGKASTPTVAELTRGSEDLSPAAFQARFNGSYVWAVEDDTAEVGVATVRVKEKQPDHRDKFTWEEGDIVIIKKGKKNGSSANNA